MGNIKNMENRVVGSLETGGTKMVCAVVTLSGKVMEQVSIPTREPEETLKEVISYFQDKEIEALGIATFGPVDLNKNSETYGHILKTPKPGWSGFDLLGTLQEALKIPMEIDTDVNGSCIGEVTFGSAKGLSNVAYITIGTGIGAGLYVNGDLVHGAMHPEMGHMLLEREPGDLVKSFCPFHENCFEGLAAGPSIKMRYGKEGKDLYEVKEVWELEAAYIAKACVNLMMTLSPERIILGGGVMHQEEMFPLIREKAVELIQGYLDFPLMKNMEQYIVPASLKDDQGILGCVCLARKALNLITE